MRDMSASTVAILMRKIKNKAWGKHIRKVMLALSKHCSEVIARDVLTATVATNKSRKTEKEKGSPDGDGVDLFPASLIEPLEMQDSDASTPEGMSSPRNPEKDLKGNDNSTAITSSMKRLEYLIDGMINLLFHSTKGRPLPTPLFLSRATLASRVE